MLLMRAYTSRCWIPFQNARATSKGSQFRRMQKAPKLVTIATAHGLSKILCEDDNHHIHLSTNADNFVKTDPILTEIFD